MLGSRACAALGSRPHTTPRASLSPLPMTDRNPRVSRARLRRLSTPARKRHALVLLLVSGTIASHGAPSFGASTVQSTQPASRPDVSADSSAAEETTPFVSTVDLFDAAPFLGDWRLHLHAAGHTTSFDLELAPDAASARYVTAQLRSEGRRLEIVDLGLADRNLVVRYLRPTALGEREAELVVLEVARSGDSAERLAGFWRTPRDLYRLPLEVEAASTGDDDDGAELGDASKSVELARTLDGRVRLTGPDLSVGGPDHAKLRDLAPGETLTWLGPPLVLQLERPARLGAVLLAPGRYSLWLRRDLDGAWLLTVNERVPMWGTQEQPAGDLGDVPLALEPAAASNRLTAQIGAQELIVRWGDQRWLAPLVVQR